MARHPSRTGSDDAPETDTIGSPAGSRPARREPVQIEIPIPGASFARPARTPRPPATRPVRSASSGTSTPEPPPARASRPRTPRPPAVASADVHSRATERDTGPRKASRARNEQTPAPQPVSSDSVKRPRARTPKPPAVSERPVATAGPNDPEREARAPRRRTPRPPPVLEVPPRPARPKLSELEDPYEVAAPLFSLGSAFASEGSPALRRAPGSEYSPRPHPTRTTSSRDGRVLHTPDASGRNPSRVDPDELDPPEEHDEGIPAHVLLADLATPPALLPPVAPRSDVLRAYRIAPPPTLAQERPALPGARAAEGLAVSAPPAGGPTTQSRGPASDEFGFPPPRIGVASSTDAVQGIDWRVPVGIVASFAVLGWFALRPVDPPMASVTASTVSAPEHRTAALAPVPAPRPTLEPSRASPVPTATTVSTPVPAAAPSLPPPPTPPTPPSTVASARPPSDAARASEPHRSPTASENASPPTRRPPLLAIVEAPPTVPSKRPSGPPKRVQARPLDQTGIRSGVDPFD
jgi:hypothetical protein